MIVADDLGWNAVGYHGGFARTPHIDRIAQYGVQLDRFYVSPMCSPTRAGLMTGRYPLRLGMGRTVVRPWARYGLSPDQTTLAEALREAGYASRAAIGKWHLGHLEARWHPLSQGFTFAAGCYNGAADYWTREREGEIDWHINAQPVQPKGYTTDLIADEAVRFIRESVPGGPFFCYVAFTAPHGPFQAPDDVIARYQALDDTPDDGKPSRKQILAAMIACLDQGVGRILQAISDEGIGGETLVWFLSDNGGVPDIEDNNTPLRGSKLTVYEGGVRVPAAVWWPGVIEGGRKITTPMSHVDVLPTLLQAASGQVESARPLDGLGMFEILTGKAGAEMPQRDLYHFTGQNGLDREQLAILSADGWKLVIIGPDVRQEGGYRTPKHRVELFHLARDPLEKTDLAGQELQRVEALGDRLVAFRRSEPDGAMAVTPTPAGFRPPPQWRNPLADRK